MTKELDTPFQRTKEKIATDIVQIIAPYDDTEKGERAVFETLACLLVDQANRLFCEEHAAVNISEMINEYIAVAREEEKEL